MKKPGAGSWLPGVPSAFVEYAPLIRDQRHGVKDYFPLFKILYLYIFSNNFCHAHGQLLAFEQCSAASRTKQIGLYR